MAITVSYLGPAYPPPDPGMLGYERIRLTGDGAAVSATVTLPATAPGKTILGCVGHGYHNIPTAGVAAATGFTWSMNGTAAVLPAATFIDLLLLCRGS